MQATSSKGEESCRKDRRSSSPLRESSPSHSSRRDRDRHSYERRERKSHSHRQDRDRVARENRHGHKSSRHREAEGDSPQLGSSSHRHRTDQGRDSKRRRPQPDDSERRSSYKAGSSIDPQNTHQARSHRTSPCHQTRDSRDSVRDRDERKHRHSSSRMRSPLPQATSSSDRIPPRPSSPPVPATTEPFAEEDAENDAPNFAPSGLLAAESNTHNGIVLKYHEPPEAHKPKTAWRLYCFKDGKEQHVLHLGAQSAYLLGRDRTVVDIPLDHESCSKQHAVLQFRQTITTNDFGDKKKRIQPYLIDLESINGSYVNDKEIPTSRYYQLRTGDTLTFGASTREYVLLDESSA